MVGDLQNLIAMALGAEPVTTTVEGRERYTVSIRYPRDYRSDPQAIATEVADYSKKFFEEGTQAFEQLLGTKSVEKAMELQQVYFKNAYEGFVTQATKISTLYADLVKETYKPFEGYVAKITPAK